MVSGRYACVAVVISPWLSSAVVSDLLSSTGRISGVYLYGRRKFYCRGRTKVVQRERDTREREKKKKKKDVEHVCVMAKNANRKQRNPDLGPERPNTRNGWPSFFFVCVKSQIANLAFSKSQKLLHIQRHYSVNEVIRFFRVVLYIWSCRVFVNIFLARGVVLSLYHWLLQVQDAYLDILPSIHTTCVKSSVALASLNSAFFVVRLFESPLLEDNHVLFYARMRKLVSVNWSLCLFCVSIKHMLMAEISCILRDKISNFVLFVDPEHQEETFKLFMKLADKDGDGRYAYISTNSCRNRCKFNK